MSYRTLDEQVALVTGAGRNIGRAIALSLAGAGATVVVNVRASIGEGQAVVDEIMATGGRAMLCTADVTQRDQVDGMLHKTRQAYGRLDILINNAAIRDESAFEQLSYADWRQALDVCLE